MPATLPIAVGSSDCDPGGFAARGVQAYDIDGTLLTWNGETWQPLNAAQNRAVQALVAGDWLSAPSTEAAALAVLAPPHRDWQGLKVWTGERIDIRQCGAKCDGAAIFDANVTGTVASAMTVTSASGRAYWTQADVGKPCGHRFQASGGGFSRAGTIAAVAADGKSCTINVNGVNASGNQTFVWGSDDTAALLLAEEKAAEVGLPIFVPAGITIATQQIQLRGGTTIIGAGPQVHRNNYTNDGYFGSTIICLSVPTLGIGGFICQGKASDNNKNYGWVFWGLRVDGFYRAASAIGYLPTAPSNRNGWISHCWVGHGTGQAYESTASGRVDFCVFTQTNAGYVVRLNGDSQMTNCKMWGAGSGFEVVLCAGSDVLLAGCHFWKDGGVVLPGGLVRIQASDAGKGVTTAPANGSVTIMGNCLDTAYGDCITIDVAANTGIRAVNIIGNTAFNNDGTVNNSGAFVKVNIASGGVLKALNIGNNAIQASWNDPTKGQWASFVNGSGIVGSLIGSSVAGNTADGCNAGFVSFTPTVGANQNVYIAGNGSTATAF